MKPKQRSVYSQLQKSRHSSQNTLHTHWLRTRKMQEAQYRHLPIARCQFSLFKQSASSQNVQKLYSISIVQVCCNRNAGVRACILPKIIYIYQLKIKGPSLQNFSQFPNCQYKIPIHKCFLHRFFPPFFLSFLISFFLTALKLVMG